MTRGKARGCGCTRARRRYSSPRTATCRDSSRARPPWCARPSSKFRSATTSNRFGSVHVSPMKDVDPRFLAKLRQQAEFTDAQLDEFLDLWEVISVRKKDHYLREGEI